MSQLHDGGARRTIRDDTDKTLFVEAGAGSGKTKSLIDRVETLVLRDGVLLRNVAAVTFTEKAGAELRDRLRVRFEAARRTADEQVRQRGTIGLEDLDSAAIGTLHSFAQWVLTMHPIEASLPPLIEVLDEVASSVAFDERWSVMQRQLLDEAELSEVLLLAMSVGVKLDHVRSLARAFSSDWDLIDERVLNTPPPQLQTPDLADLLATALTLADRAGECSKDGDLFLSRLEALGSWAERLRNAHTPGDLFAAVVAAADLRFSNGKGGSWPDLPGLRGECHQLQKDAEIAAAKFKEAVLRPIAYWVAARVREAAGERAAEGRLEFHDLLVLARDLLRNESDVRASLQRRFRRLLLDEFQDTDPIQIELAVRIAGGAEATAADWRDVDIPLGSLFVVGDPKQSIYRFRRADIKLYLQAQDRVGESVKLTTNFRTASPILDWVNATFAELIQPVEHAQPSYQALMAHRTEPTAGPPVVVLGSDAHTDNPNASTLRKREAADVAAVITQALAEGWTIEDLKTHEWRPVRPGDIAILLPARTSLPFLEEALDGAGVSYRAESSSLVYQATEVRELMAAARVVADPSDQLSCVTALRSSLFGCGDDDLWTWKRSGGSFNILASVPGDLLGHPVGEAVSCLQTLHRKIRWMTPSEVLAALVVDRRMLEVAASGSRARDQWRRLRFVVDQARAWSEVEHGGLRSYLAWAARQSEEASRVAEAILPETDVDAVRIMTVHAAKGLEFPIVVLSGMSSQTKNSGGVRVLWTDTGYAARLTKAMQTNDFEAVQPVDEQMDRYERRRLLYVAATRARDHLVVSLHRSGSGTETNAKLLAKAGAATAAGAVAHAGHVPALSGADGRVSPAPPPDWDDWLASLTAAQNATLRVSAVSASGLEGTEPAVALNSERDDDEVAGSAKGARDVDLPPWSKGRYGSAIGRAVHGVLQTVDLSDGSGIEAAVSAQCIAEGVVEFSDVVAALVRSALDSDLVKRAAVREHWRESYVATVRADGTVVEGIADLIYREDDGSLVVVDYKTDAVPAAALSARAAFYAPQIEAYTSALRDASQSAVRAQLLFLHPTAPAQPV